MNFKTIFLARFLNLLDGAPRVHAKHLDARIQLASLETQKCIFKVCVLSDTLKSLRVAGVFKYMTIIL